MPNPLGINGTQYKPLRDALRVELAALGTDNKGYRKLAQALLQRAFNGDTTALGMCLDRLDGKVPQPVGGSDELGPTRLHITWKSPADQVEEQRLQLESANSAALPIDNIAQSD
jgi:hypothetical protein